MVFGFPAAPSFFSKRMLLSIEEFFKRSNRCILWIYLMHFRFKRFLKLFLRREFVSHYTATKCYIHRIQIEWTSLSKMMLSNCTLYSTKPFIMHPKIHKTFHYLLEIYWKICSGFISHREMSLIVLLNYTSCALL